jgi:hypothetical protein
MSKKAELIWSVLLFLAALGLINKYIAQDQLIVKIGEWIGVILNFFLSLMLLVLNKILGIFGIPVTKLFFPFAEWAIAWVLGLFILYHIFIAMADGMKKKPPPAAKKKGH